MAEVSEQETPVQKQPRERQDIIELDAILEELSSLIVLCEETMSVCADLKKQDDVQRQLKTYASGLVSVARCLQYLNDFRRLVPQVTERSTAVRQSLITARGGEQDALVSEEARVLQAVEHVKETVMQSIQALESVLSHVRQSTPPLLAAIGFSSPHFESFAVSALQAIRVDIVANTVFSERERLRALRQDIQDVYLLKEHADGLQ